MKISTNNMNQNQLLNSYEKLNVEIISTKHFIDALNVRVFPLNVIGIAAIEASSLEIGESKEIFSSKRFKATVELKRVSNTVALLLTGWKGLRRSIKNNTK